MLPSSRSAAAGTLRLEGAGVQSMSTLVVTIRARFESCSRRLQIGVMLRVGGVKVLILHLVVVRMPQRLLGRVFLWLAMKLRIR